MYLDNNKDKKNQWKITLHYIKLTHRSSFMSINLIVERGQVIHPQPQTPQGQSFALPGTLLLIILIIVWKSYTATQCHKTLRTMTLQWRHNDHNGVSNHHRLECLLNRVFRRKSKKTPKLRVTGFCEGSSPVTGEVPAQRASNAENVSIWLRHHDITYAIQNKIRGYVKGCISARSKTVSGGVAYLIHSLIVQDLCKRLPYNLPMNEASCIPLTVFIPLPNKKSAWFTRSCCRMNYVLHEIKPIA